MKLFKVLNITPNNALRETAKRACVPPLFVAANDQSLNVQHFYERFIF